MSLSESADTSFFDGREFSSFEELSHGISEYEKRFFVNLYIRSSRSIESAKRRAPNKVFSEDLKFSELDFSCKEGGRKIVSKSKGIRPNQRYILCEYSVFLSCLYFELRIPCLSDCAFLVCLIAHG